jgi:hypothetical protein
MATSNAQEFIPHPYGPMQAVDQRWVSYSQKCCSKQDREINNLGTQKLLTKKPPVETVM